MVCYEQRPHSVERIRFAHRLRYLRVTAVVAVAELLLVFGSLVLLDTVAVFTMTAPPGVLGLTWTTIVKVTEADGAKPDVVQVMVPVLAPFVDGSVQLQPAAPEFETKFVLVGNTSFRLTSVAIDGPLLVTTTV